MLGHGFDSGLFNYVPSYVTDAQVMNFTIINDTHVPYLRNKYCVAIWCFASSFFEYHKLHGFASGMFISEMKEAQMFGVPASQSQIDLSNELFAAAMNLNIDFNDVRTFNTVFNSYQSNTNKVIQFNRQLLKFFP